jgi:hypothetical protein
MSNPKLTKYQCLEIIDRALFTTFGNPDSNPDDDYEYSRPYNYFELFCGDSAVSGVEFIESHGGGEGGGEYCYGIIKIDGLYFKAEWSYYSYSGCEYDYIKDTVKQVFPVQKMVTLYK